MDTGGCFVMFDPALLALAALVMGAAIGWLTRASLPRAEGPTS